MRFSYQPFSFKTIITCTALIVLLAAVHTARAAATYDTINGDPVLINVPVNQDTPRIIYPLFYLWTDLTWTQQLAEVHSLSYAGTDDWFVPTDLDLAYFFGSYLSYDNPGTGELGNSGGGYFLRTADLVLMSHPYLQTYRFGNV